MKMSDFNFIVESVHGDEREELGRAANEKLAWVIAREWIDRQFNSPKIYYIRKWFVSVNCARYDFGSHTWFIEITDSKLKAFDIVADYRNSPETTPYTVRAHNKSEAKRYFESKFGHLKIFSVEQRDESLGEPAHYW